MEHSSKREAFTVRCGLEHNKVIKMWRSGGGFERGKGIRGKSELWIIKEP